MQTRLTSSRRWPVAARLFRRRSHEHWRHTQAVTLL